MNYRTFIKAKPEIPENLIQTADQIAENYNTVTFIFDKSYFNIVGESTFTMNIKDVDTYGYENLVSDRFYIETNPHLVANPSIIPYYDTVFKSTDHTQKVDRVDAYLNNIGFKCVGFFEGMENIYTLYDRKFFGNDNIKFILKPNLLFQLGHEGKNEMTGLNFFEPNRISRMFVEGSYTLADKRDVKLAQIDF